MLLLAPDNCRASVSKAFLLVEILCKYNYSVCSMVLLTSFNMKVNLYCSMHQNGILLCVCVCMHARVFVCACLCVQVDVFACVNGYVCICVCVHSNGSQRAPLSIIP